MFKWTLKTAKRRDLVNYANLYADVLTGMLGRICSVLEANGGIKELVFLGTPL